MGLMKEHNRPPGQQKAKRGQNQDNYMRIERVLEEIVCDLTNGCGRYDVIRKLEQGLYESQEKPLSHSHSNTYYATAVERMSWQREENIDKCREIMWNRYENLYRECMENNDRKSARQCLQDMVKLFGLSKEQNQQLEVKTDNKTVTVTFGFKENGAET